MDMKEVIQHSPEQITHSREVNKEVKVGSDVDAIIVAGMGGSGHPGDLLSALDLPTVPLTVHRDYDLPPTHAQKPLVIVSTYSGNTEESLSAYSAAKEKGYSLLANTSGGQLEEWAGRDNVPLVTIDYAGMQPRHTLFASFVGIATALANSGLAKNIDAQLDAAVVLLQEQMNDMEEIGKKLAEGLTGTTPVFTSATSLAFAAKNFKIQTNENVKTPAFWNTFPELNHNEMVGFTNPQASFHAVMLRDSADHPRNKARMEVTADLYRQWGLHVSHIDVKGDSQVEKIFYAVTIGLWTTYYLALAYDIDPVPVAGVENFKKKLEEVAGKM
jgi:glucose/mannose-6-phosphate isomerase